MILSYFEGCVSACVGGIDLKKEDLVKNERVAEQRYKRLRSHTALCESPEI